MEDFPRVQRGETPVLVVATGEGDPLYQPSDGAVPYACDLCGRPVSLDLKSQALLPIRVICLWCYAASVRAGHGIVLRRA